MADLQQMLLDQQAENHAIIMSLSKCDMTRQDTQS
jgi:hypothetical protein